MIGVHSKGAAQPMQLLRVKNTSKRQKQGVTVQTGSIYRREKRQEPKRNMSGPVDELHQGGNQEGGGNSLVRKRLLRHSCQSTSENSLTYNKRPYENGTGREEGESNKIELPAGKKGNAE